MNAESLDASAVDPELTEFNSAVALAAASLPQPVARRVYRQVLLAYDGTPDAQAALERVPAVASAGTEVTVATVIPYEAVSSSLDPIKPADRQWQWDCLIQATAYLRTFGIDPFIEAAAGTPAAVIREIAQSLQADLVVLGCGRGRRWHPSLKRRPVRRRLDSQLSCDTLVVRDASRGDLGHARRPRE